MDGTTLILRHGEDGAADHLLQLPLGDGHRPAGIHVGQLRVVVAVLRGDGEGGKARTDGHLVGLVHHHGDGPLGQPPDDVAEELGREDALAGIGDLGLDFVGNGGFHIIARQTNSQTRLAENPFDDGEAALLGHGAAGDIQALHQTVFFTGKSHSPFPFL